MPEKSQIRLSYKTETQEGGGEEGGGPHIECGKRQKESNSAHWQVKFKGTYSILAENGEEHPTGNGKGENLTNGFAFQR